MASNARRSFGEPLVETQGAGSDEWRILLAGEQPAVTM